MKSFFMLKTDSYLIMIVLEIFQTSGHFSQFDIKRKSSDKLLSLVSTCAWNKVNGNERIKRSIIWNNDKVFFFNWNIRMVLNSLRKYMVFVGTVKSDSTGNQKMLIMISNCFCFIAIFLYWTAIFCYFVFEAQTLNDYTECGYFVIISTTEATMYLLIFSAREEFYQLFNNIDSLVIESRHISRLLVRMRILKNVSFLRIQGEFVE